jgi:hypothetical protein
MLHLLPIGRVPAAQNNPGGVAAQCVMHCSTAAPWPSALEIRIHAPDAHLATAEHHVLFQLWHVKHSIAVGVQGIKHL